MKAVKQSFNLKDALSRETYDEDSHTQF